MAGAQGELIGGRYRLVEPVGQGGMGRVWRAHDELLDRQVAVKEILFAPEGGERARGKQLRRMMDEARAAARLSHPGITAVYDVVEYDGSPVIVMEFVAGESLAAVLRREKRLPVARVAQIGVRLIDALAEAHASGVVHRDLKPDNILLTERRAVITDFGIARIADGSAGVTSTGVLVGTPAYISPEQLSGEPATPSSDLWSLGATLYTAVEGRNPFAGANLWALTLAICRDAPAPVRHAGPLERTLTALLTKDPARRATAEHVAHELRTLAGTPARTADQPPEPRPGRARRRWRGLLPPGRRPSGAAGAGAAAHEAADGAAAHEAAGQRATGSAAARALAEAAHPGLRARIDAVRDVERAVGDRLRSQCEMHRKLLKVMSASPPTDEDLLTGLRNLKGTHEYRVARILDDQGRKLDELREVAPPSSSDPGRELLRRSFERHVARVEELLHRRRGELSAFGAALELPATLEGVANRRAFLIDALGVFRAHLDELGSGRAVSAD